MNSVAGYSVENYKQANLMDSLKHFPESRSKGIITNLEKKISHPFKGTEQVNDQTHTWKNQASWLILEQGHNNTTSVWRNNKKFTDCMCLWNLTIHTIAEQQKWRFGVAGLLILPAGSVRGRTSNMTQYLERLLESLQEVYKSVWN